MPRTRQQKEAEVQVIREMFERANSLYLVNLHGLSTNEINLLRAALREHGARVRVVKNRLAKRATEGIAAEKLVEQFVGPTAVVSHPDEPVSTAKQLVAFAKDHPAFEIRAGLVDNLEAVDSAGVKTVAELPSVDEVRATLLSLINTPATQLARLLQTPAAQLATVLERKSEETV
ncbi:MAG: 50S ribosomal protein L10 [Acidobacteriota bacterium]|nr:MAG: 50S ribosomal protein L10 [Acidobacteriota bacterium]